MKHTKNYMDAKWVIENPEKYDNRDVVRANSFIEAYNEGYNKALSLGGDVGRSKQLVCGCGNPNLTWYGYDDDKTYFCFECKKEVKK